MGEESFCVFNHSIFIFTFSLNLVKYATHFTGQVKKYQKIKASENFLQNLQNSFSPAFQAVMMFCDFGFDIFSFHDFGNASFSPRLKLFLVLYENSQYARLKNTDVFL